jgi:hypothetical protein
MVLALYCAAPLHSPPLRDMWPAASYFATHAMRALHDAVTHLTALTLHQTDQTEAYISVTTALHSVVSYLRFHTLGAMAHACPERSECNDGAVSIKCSIQWAH